jgi:hypothetical protein
MPRSIGPCLDEGYWQAPAKRLLSDPKRAFAFGLPNGRNAPVANVGEPFRERPKKIKRVAERALCGRGSLGTHGIYSEPRQGQYAVRIDV